jgi:aspartate-semialdehyde dehydrogenase
MKTYTVAVVGALGVVGSAMIEILEEQNFPVKEFIPLDQADQVGKEVVFRGEKIKVKEATKGAFEGIDFAFFSAGGEASLELAPIAVEEGCVVIDNSSAWRMDPNVPLVIPEVNSHDLDWHHGIIANPNCSTIQMLVALKPIHDVYTIKRIVVSTYQAVSGSGKSAMEELQMQTQDLSQGIAPLVEVYPHQIAYNAIPHIDVFQDNGYTKEELKMVQETHKILDSAIKVSPTAVRIPVITGHAESINVETEKPFNIEAVKRLLEKSPGITLWDAPEKNRYPMPLDAAGKDEVFVGRIRRDDTLENGLNLWVVSDNLRKGAALNAIQIGLTLIHKTIGK